MESPACRMPASTSRSYSALVQRRVRTGYVVTASSLPVAPSTVNVTDCGQQAIRSVLWHSTAGGAFYNQNDKEKARRLLKEAGDAGQPIRWLTTPEIEYMYKPALVAKQQLEEMGFKIDLQVFAWATVVRHSNKPELFDVSSAAFVFGLDPVLHSILQCTYPGWWCLEEKERLLGELARETDARKRKTIIDRIQVLFYEDVGRIKFGDLFTLAVVRRELRGDFRSVPFFYFWTGAPFHISPRVTR